MKKLFLLSLICSYMFCYDIDINSMNQSMNNMRQQQLIDKNIELLNKMKYRNQTTMNPYNNYNSPEYSYETSRELSNHYNTFEIDRINRNKEINEQINILNEQKYLLQQQEMYNRNKEIFNY